MMKEDWIYDEEGSWNTEEVQVCGLDGCPFKGPKSVLEDHIMYLHATGVYNRLMRGNDDPKEIAAWREQRKKKYPTYSLTESARVKQESRKAQYQIINKARSEAFEQFLSERKKSNEENKSKKTKNRVRKQKKQLKRRQTVNTIKEKENFLDDEEDPPGWNGSLSAFPGTLAFMESSESESEEELDNGHSDPFPISDEEEDIQIASKLISRTEGFKPKQVSEAVKSEVKENSETDEDDGPPLEESIVREKKPIPQSHTESLVTQLPKDNDALLKSTSMNSTSNASSKNVSESSKNLALAHKRPSSKDTLTKFNEKTDESNCDSSAKKPKTEYTKSPYVIEPPRNPEIKLVRRTKQNSFFLEKLLTKEIKEERKILLQSIKYICDNNFFLHS